MKVVIPKQRIIGQSAGAVEYTDCISVRPPPNCPGNDTKQWQWVMQELWGMRSILLLPSIPGPLWPGVAVTNSVLSMGQIELNKVFLLNWIVFE